MAKIEYAQNALSDIKCLVDFLMHRDGIAALETFDIIDEAIQVLCRHPYIGRSTIIRLITDRSTCNVGKRKLVISRGKTGYIAIYIFDQLSDIVVILTIRPQCEDMAN